MLETLDFVYYPLIRIGSTPTFLHFDLYLYSAYAAHYVYFMHKMAANTIVSALNRLLFAFGLGHKKKTRVQ